VLEELFQTQNEEIKKDRKKARAAEKSGENDIEIAFKPVGKKRSSFEGFGGDVEEEKFVRNDNYKDDDDADLTDYERQALAQFKQTDQEID